MTVHRETGGSRPGMVVAGSLVTIALLSSCSDGATGRAQAEAAAAEPARVAPQLRDFRSARSPAPVPPPHRVRIPALGVDSALERLDRRADGTVEVPRRWQRAGWFRGGPRPGEPGSAVILGHVDSPRGPAVFAGLAVLPRGARVVVDRADGTSVTFRVRRTATYPRSRFPVEEVYLPTLEPSLRLITCGGPYDRRRGGYQANVVVFATAARG